MNTTTRRQALGGISCVVLGASAGCFGGRPYSERTPEAFTLEVSNSRATDAVLGVTLLEGEESVFTESFDLRADDTATRDLDLRGRSYDVVVEVGDERYEEDWQWGACETATVAIDVREDVVNVGDTCFDD